MSGPVRILLAEDHTLVRAGIKALLQNLNWVEVVAEAGDGQEAIKQIEQHQPDIALMDITMPNMNGLEALRIMKQNFPNVRIIMLSMHASEEYVLQALRAGATGYLLKDAGIGELELAIRSVSLGQSYLSPVVSKHVIGNYIQRTGGETSSLERLTVRQRQILQLIAEGCTTRQVADKLNISIKTVETHRAQLMHHLDIHDITGLVRYAIRMGLVSPGV
jgi:DNA-binding NarL/FixJ family response regulator